MSIFDFAIKKDKHKQEIIKEDIKAKSPFEYTNIIYTLINNKDKEYDNKLNNLFRNIEDSDLSFVVWILNHYLAYNNITRQNPDMFTGMFILMSPKEYILYYTRFMIYNNITFPKFMSWYKFDIDINHKKCSSFIKDNLNIDDDELEELLDYCNEKQISIKDICYNINSINEIDKTKEPF